MIAEQCSPRGSPIQGCIQDIDPLDHARGSHFWLLLVNWRLAHQSSHLSSFLPAGAAEPPLFFIALVPIPEGFGFCPSNAFVLGSLAPPKSSQKSCFSLAGPLGAAPNSSQKSFFAGSAPRRAFPEGSPSTKRLKVVPAVAAVVWIV